MTAEVSQQFSDRSPGLLQHLGFRLSSVEDATGTTVCEVDLRADLVNPAGMLQGGVIATLVDVAGGVAAARASGSHVVFTSDLTLHYLAAGRVGPVRATARVLRRGRTSVVVEVEVVDTGADNRLMTVATMTLTVPGPTS